MPHNIMRHPCQIVDSDSEDENNHQLDALKALPKGPILPRPSELKVPDWGPELNATRNHDRFGSRKTAPSFEKAPSDHKPIFSGPLNLKSRSSLIDSMLELNEGDRTMFIYTPDSPPASPYDNISNFDPISLLQENLNKFIYTYIPKDYPSFIQCTLRRDRTGIQKGFFPTFYLHAERPSDGKKFFLLAARKVAKVNRQSEYLLSTNTETLSDKTGGDGYLGKLRENNVTGTEYTLYDNGISPNKHGNKHSNNKNDLRSELAGIVYKTNVLGFKGPRQMNVVLPKLGYDIQPAKNEKSILDEWHNRRFDYLVQLRNRSPKFNEQTKTYLLDFFGERVAQPSVRNFQIILENENHEEEVVMQFGRVNNDTFTCDYRYPLSAIQAFGIALSSFKSRLVRE